MIQKPFNAAATKTRVSQNVLRKRIIRYMRDLQRELLRKDGNQSGDVVTLHFGEGHTDEPYETTKGDMKFYLTFHNMLQEYPQDYDGPSQMIVECEFRPGERPDIYFTRTDMPGRSEDSRLLQVLVDPKSMAPIREKLESFLASQFARLEDHAGEWESKARNTRSFVAALKASAKALKPAVQRAKLVP